MITCSKCGIGNRDEAKFCSSCGTSLSELCSDDSAYQKLRTSKRNVVLSVLWDVFWSGVVMYPIFVAYRMVQPSISSNSWIFPWIAASIVLVIAGIFEIQNSYIELSRNGISKCYRFKGLKSIEWRDIKLVSDIDYSSSFIDWIFSRPQVVSTKEHISYPARHFSRNDQLNVANYIEEYAPQVGLGKPSLKEGEVWWWKEVCNDFYGIRPFYRMIFLTMTWFAIIIYRIHNLNFRTGAIQPWDTSDDPILQWGIFYFVSMIAFHEYKRWSRSKKYGGVEK